MIRASWKILLYAFLILVLLVTVAGCIKTGKAAAGCQIFPACSPQKASDDKAPPAGNQSGAGAQPSGQDSNVITQSGGVAVSNWIGTWQCGNTKMYLNQTGDQVTGWYDFENGRIQGKATGNTLSGTWSESPSFSGTFLFAMSADSKSFQGTRMGSPGTPISGSLNGIRISSARPPDAPAQSGAGGKQPGSDQPSGSQSGIGVLQPGTAQPSGGQSGAGVIQSTQSTGWIGTWQCGSTTLYLTQSANWVTGWSNYQNGRMVGNIDKNTISGTWSTYPDEWSSWHKTVNVQFVMSLDGNSYEWKQSPGSITSWDVVGKCIRTSSSQPPTSPPPANWSGYWLCGQFGRLILTQSGEDVTGTYSHQGGMVRGKAIGNMLVGTWLELPTYDLPDDLGYFKFKISADGNSFNGEWCKGTTGVDGKWNGQRQN